jgi:CheY-like chemotaxis protein
MPPADSTVSPKSSLLVVDDQPFMAYHMRLVLQQDGYDVAAAFNAEDAWTLFQREAPRVRAVVPELARRVHRAAPNTPVRLVTGYALPGSLGPNCRF